MVVLEYFFDVKVIRVCFVDLGQLLCRLGSWFWISVNWKLVVFKLYSINCLIWIFVKFGCYKLFWLVEIC